VVIPCRVHHIIAGVQSIASFDGLGDLGYLLIAEPSMVRRAKAVRVHNPAASAHANRYLSNTWASGIHSTAWLHM